MRVLLVEDDTVMAKSIEMMLRSEGYVCDITACGENCLVISKFTDYDLIILDLMLPDTDGYETLRRLRAAEIQWPILILSGLDESRNIIKGLSLGADDFLTKPFDRGELVARIQTLVRRSKKHPESIIYTGKMAVNLDNRIVMVDGNVLRLAPQEYQVLEMLALCKGGLVTKDMLINHLSMDMAGPPLKFVNVLMSRLRKKLSEATGGDEYIHTIWGCGYELRDQKITSGRPNRVEAGRLVP